MFEGFDRVLKNQIDPHLAPMTKDEEGRSYVRPIHLLDMVNLIGNSVVVGGVRRTAEIFLFEVSDYEVMLAKYGINGLWSQKDVDNHQKVGKILEAEGIKPSWFDDLGAVGKRRTGLDHRRMSNNSVAFTEKPRRQQLNLIFSLLKAEGEPGMFNLEEALRRRPNAEGVNPCGEIILDSKQVCNLTTVNVDAFVREITPGVYKLDRDGLIEAQRLSTRIGVRMTLAELELPEWDFKQKRDHLVGTSVTGWQDALGKLGMSDEDEQGLMEEMREASRSEADRYAYELRIPTPLLATTVKPEGTLSQVAGAVSAGVHVSHSPYYIRRIRINANDPLVQVALELGWRIHADIGTNGYVDMENLAKQEQIQAARTLVIDFPVKSGATKTKDKVRVDEQFDTYFRFQKHYTEHNSSNTVSIREDEWDRAEERVWEGWDDFVGVSFLADDGGTYQLAPYEECTEAEYNELKNSMEPFDAKLLHKYEKSETEEDLDNMDSCSSGVCPIR
jgi:ribonucleoside-triphosphate reductase (thioredoxin)